MLDGGLDGGLALAGDLRVAADAGAGPIDADPSTDGRCRCVLYGGDDSITAFSVAEHGALTEVDT